VPAVEVDPLRGFTRDDIESFEALGVEVLSPFTGSGDLRELKRVRARQQRLETDP
jgi:hypothetical protein